MEINHALYKLKIETTDHSSSQEEEEEEEEKVVKRNWLELPPDVTSLIFLKLGTVDILGSAQWVCSSWWKLCKQPHLFRSIQLDFGNGLHNRFDCGRYDLQYIHVKKVYTVSGYHWSLVVPNGYNFRFKLSEGLAREAIDRSCGQLVELYVQAMPIDELLHYMSDKSSSLRTLRLVKVGLVGYEYGSDYSDHYVRNDEFIEEMAKEIPHLEELEIIKCSDFSKDVIESFGRFCPQLKSFRLNCERFFWDDTQFNEVALAIAENMPELRHLNLFGNPLTNDDLRAILDGCPHLESLDLRRCLHLFYEQGLKEICKNIKVLRLPYDPTDDYEYESDDDLYDYLETGADFDHFDGYLSM